jgi:hypothetical protein
MKIYGGDYRVSMEGLQGSRPRIAYLEGNIGTHYAALGCLRKSAARVSPVFPYHSSKLKIASTSTMISGSLLSPCIFVVVCA